ncbi:protein patched homolog 1-like [Anthonomus grandis grandis]|uniref:protein patched homolog 1-like n=1 Tax=Anthonomus grandis grandis TaxID=2921223 RepID=UPI0021662F52|nr:protein patched homolog 1-like [Anthonomus grandis grandis]
MTCKINKIFEKFTFAVVTNTEAFFYKLGVSIAQKPLKTILLCWILVFLSAFGFLRFRQEKNPLKLWVPPDTAFVRDSEWLMSTFQRGFSDEAITIVADDVLTPKVIRKLGDIHTTMMKAKTDSNITMIDVCFRIPKVNKKLLKLMLSDTEQDEDPSTTMSAALYCSFIETMKTDCYTKSILELWDFNITHINTLTKDDIVNTINNYDKNMIFGKLKSYEHLLGDVERNETGHIIKAKAIENYWLLLVNFSSVDMNKAGNMAGTGEWASEEALDWENTFLKIAQNISIEDGEVYYFSGRSFGDISNKSMFQDMDKLCIGIAIMVVYVQFVISKFNWLEARIVLGTVGLLTIVMGFTVGAGLCALFGIFYGPVHMSLPFLLMGLGVDDMLVIMTCWDELSVVEQRLPLPERVGLMLKHAGVSITITSFTDVIAFIIGSSTILPCLESFCIYAAFGVFMTFIFAITFFTACFVLDQKRLESGRNGVLPWIEHPNYKPNKCSQSRITNKVFEFVYGKIILTVPGKVVVILFTLACAGFSIESTLRLEQRFDPRWFLPEGTHLADFLRAREAHFPHVGFDAGMYMGSLNYSQELTKIKDAVDKLENMTDITSNVMSWVDPFRTFVLVNFKHDVYEKELDEARFNVFMSKFLHSPRYAKYQGNFVFESDLECGAPIPKIKMSSIDFNIKRFPDPRQHIVPMHRVMEVAEKANFTSGDRFATVWSKFFAMWITDELIDVEVMRNLELALLCVMACTILLIADLQTCFWIFICVLVTMINVCGFMQRWGLTIDLVSCIGLELAIGLCVDYATHIGHTFLTIHEGSKKERALRTVSSIGSAVLYGGLSTFIGVFMMSQSDAYTFQSFFKIFTLVIIFGLFHGTVLFPVILSLIGPKPYKVQHSVPIPQRSQEENGVEIVEVTKTSEGWL